jgi:hypothetical protein
MDNENAVMLLKERITEGEAVIRGQQGVDFKE